MLSVLSLSQLELYPKLWIHTSLNAASCGSHSRGQYSDGSPDFVQVLRDPPPRPCTKIRLATTEPEGSKSVFNPYSRLASLDESLLASRLERARAKEKRLEAEDVGRCLPTCGP